MFDLRQLSSDELDQIKPLFETVFGVPFSLELMRWKYADGRGASWTAWDGGGGPAVHCGLMYRQVIFRGRRVRGAQLVDLMARPKSQGLSRESSPFAVLMHHLLDNLPCPDHPDGFAFGFPSDRAMRLGERLGVYRSVDHILELSLLPARRRFAPRFRPYLPASASDRALLERCWQAMARDLGDFAVGVRDPAYIAWRYFAHPQKKYTVLVLRSYFLGKVLGLAVVGPGSDGHYELLDVICALDSVPEILAGVQGWLASVGGNSLSFLLTRHFARQLEPFASGCSETQFRIMANPKMNERLLLDLDHRWWMTGGDTDYR